MPNKSISFDSWKQEDEYAAAITTMYQSWQSDKEGAMSEWEEIQLYRFATDTTTLFESGFDHTTHIPIVAELHDDLAAIMYSTILPHNDWLGWKATDFESSTQAKRKKALAFIKNRHTMNGFRQTMNKVIDDFISTGNCFVQMHFVDETTTSPELKKGYRGPQPRRISPYDMTFDPTAATFEESGKIVRELISIGELVKRSRIETNGYKQATIDMIKDRRSTRFTADQGDAHKNAQYIPDGFNSIESYMDSGMVEILWFYGDVWDEEAQELKEKVCVGVVDRFNVLFEFDCANPRIRRAGWTPRADNLWCQSPLSRVVGINFQVDHRENAKSDALDRFIYPDRVYVGDVEEVYDDETKQTKLLAPENGGVQNLAPESSVLAFDGQIDRLTAQARSAVRLPPQLMGFRTPGEKTLGEVQNLDQGAYRGFIHKAEQFELDLLEKLIQDELEISVAHMGPALEVLDETSDGQEVIYITAEDLDSNGLLVPYGARRFSRELQQMSALMQIGNGPILQVIAKHMDSYALAQTIERLGGFEAYDIFAKFAAIDEQAAMQLHQSNSEMATNDAMDQPSIGEVNTMQQMDEM